LIDRDVVEVSGSYPYGYSEMSVYKTNQRLKDKCGEFEKYEMGDASLLDKHLLSAIYIIIKLRTLL
jgi:hypothetical protein